MHKLLDPVGRLRLKRVDYLGDGVVLSPAVSSVRSTPCHIKEIVTSKLLVRAIHDACGNNHMPRSEGIGDELAAASKI